MQMSADVSPPDLASELASLTEAATGLGRETVDIGGFLQDLDEQCHEQQRNLSEVETQSAHLTAAGDRTALAVQRMAQTADQAIERVKLSSNTIAENSQRSQEMAEWVRALHESSSEVEDMLRAVQQSNTEISDIAWQVHLLAVNAKIEAARAGAAGKGFSIVADSVSDLSAKTSHAADSITATVERLTKWMADLHTGAQTTARKADSVLSGSSTADRALQEIETHVDSLRTEAHSLSNDADQSQRASQTVTQAVQALHDSVEGVSQGVDEATKRCLTLADTSENIMQHAVALGGDGEDAPMITLVQDVAGQIIQAFEHALDHGMISLDEIFDDIYRPIPDTNPQQMLTRFTKLTDQILPAIQEPILGRDERIVFCAAVDRNGYLPTHNKKFAHRPSQDPVWNAAHCRNRRIFDDRTGLKAGRNEKPFLLQVYRRDMGGGTFVMMKDLSAPITLRGRHWGAVRLAYRL